MTKSHGMIKVSDTPTLDLIGELETAYRWFNEKLFSSKLKPCILVLHRKRSAYGYFWAERWEETNGEAKYHEVALNPDTLKRPVEQVLSTLVHEQVHLWQQDFGKPAKGKGHNREWADKMEDVGLMPSRTGEPGGRRTGRRVSHYIMKGEEFDRACTELLDTGFSLSYVSFPALTTTRKRTPRVTYTCDQCETKVRGKEGTNVLCGDCTDDDGRPVIMECDD